MLASVVLAGFCATLVWLGHHIGRRAVSAAATGVGVFALAARVGVDLERFGDTFGALVLTFFLVCVSQVLLADSDRTRGHRAAQRLLGVFWFVFGMGFAMLNILGSGNVGRLTSVLDIFLIEGSIRQALGSEYAKLLDEYDRQVHTIDALRRSLSSSCKEFTTLVRHRNLGMSAPRRPLSKYLAVHRDAEWEEPSIISRLCKYFPSCPPSSLHQLSDLSSSLTLFRQRRPTQRFEDFLASAAARFRPHGCQCQYRQHQRPRGRDPDRATENCRLPGQFFGAAAARVSVPTQPKA
jgi:hypothetical protein